MLPKHPCTYICTCIYMKKSGYLWDSILCKKCLQCCCNDLRGQFFKSGHTVLNKWAQFITRIISLFPEVKRKDRNLHHTSLMVQHTTSYPIHNMYTVQWSTCIGKINGYTSYYIYIQYQIICTCIYESNHTTILYIYAYVHRF